MRQDLMEFASTFTLLSYTLLHVKYSSHLFPSLAFLSALVYASFILATINRRLTSFFRSSSVTLRRALSIVASTPFSLISLGFVTSLFPAAGTEVDAEAEAIPERVSPTGSRDKGRSR